MAEDAIRIMCPNLLCRKVLAVPPTARGKTVRCKSCSTTIRIPDKPAGSSPSPEPKPEQAT
ncbi:hypothetical protein MNBD_PLANCTO03-2197 [hydrothermal vent metagenome]|uniref:Zinc finger/thioredoxin putative domain-containing protein n=1 Tax=hydrothermal vent metagenome TaxID=652676 RepID=A0A3B1E7J5_9ZZZZ